MGFCCAQSSGAQDSIGKTELKETFPIYPGGEKALVKYLVSNMQYATKADRLNHDHIGVVKVQFTISEDGSIDDNVSILKSVSEYYDKEAIRLIKEMPNWTPGTQDGVPVKVGYNLPVRF